MKLRPRIRDGAKYHVQARARPAEGGECPKNNKITRIDYLYDAAGKKVAKKVHYYEPGGSGGGGSEMKGETANATPTNSSVGSATYVQKMTQTDYLAGGFQYKDEVLDLIPHAEGFIKLIEGDYVYHFNYTDHLGNVRLTYKDKGGVSIVEESNYYPFGLEHSGYNNPDRSAKDWGNIVTGVTELDYKYKYNGKEFQDELGLNMYAMDMRQFDPAIARWVVLDPITHYSLSPYNAFDNNPVFWADPSGGNSEGGFTINNGVVYGQGHWSDGLRTEHWTNPSSSNDDKKKEESSSNLVTTSNLAESSPELKFPDWPKNRAYYEKKYPRLTKVMKQTYEYVKANNEILQLMSSYTGLSQKEVLRLLKYNEGATLEEQDMEVTQYGRTSPKATFIALNSKWIGALEKARGETSIQATSFLIMTTILHEIIHYGRTKNGLEDTLGEYGKGFESDAFGGDVNKSNAYKLYKQNGWNFKDK